MQQFTRFSVRISTATADFPSDERCTWGTRRKPAQTSTALFLWLIQLDQLFSTRLLTADTGGSLEAVGRGDPSVNFQQHRRQSGIVFDGPRAGRRDFPLLKSRMGEAGGRTRRGPRVGVSESPENNRRRRRRQEAAGALQQLKIESLIRLFPLFPRTFRRLERRSGLNDATQNGSRQPDRGRLRGEHKLTATCAGKPSRTEQSTKSMPAPGRRPRVRFVDGGQTALGT